MCECKCSNHWDSAGTQNRRRRGNGDERVINHGMQSKVSTRSPRQYNRGFECSGSSTRVGWHSISSTGHERCESFPSLPVPSPALMNTNYRATGKGECHYRMVHHCVDCVLWVGLSYGNYSVRGQIKIKHKRRDFRIYFLNCPQAVPQDQWQRMRGWQNTLQRKRSSLGHVLSRLS